MPPLEPPRMGEPYLLTPGPLKTSYAVKAAMLCDHGSWDSDFRAMTAYIRARLVALLGNPAFDCVPLQGSGSFAAEAMLGSFIPRDGAALVLSNGAYGQRAAAALRVMGRAVRVLEKGDFAPPPGPEVAAILAVDPAITHVVDIHCETSGGIPVRRARYFANRDRLVAGMRGLGFTTLLADECLSPIITTFHAPADPAFDFGAFYDAMKARGFIIYPGQLTKVDSFRLGHIGQMDPHVMARVVAAVDDSMGALGMRDCRPEPEALATGEIA